MTWLVPLFCRRHRYDELSGIRISQVSCRRICRSNRPVKLSVLIFIR